MKRTYAAVAGGLLVVAGLGVFGPAPMVHAATSVPSSSDPSHCTSGGGGGDGCNSGGGTRSGGGYPGTPPDTSQEIDGSDLTKRLTCLGDDVTVAGNANNVTIVGHCHSVTVTGDDNQLAIDSADTITAHGDRNRVIFVSGTPQTTMTGDGDVVRSD